MPEKIINQFFIELDKKWKAVESRKIPLHIIGSSALMLQIEYTRGTKDSDVLETKEISPQIEEKLIQLGGKGSGLHRQFNLYLDFVNYSLPFLPQTPRFHTVASLKPLKHFEISALDITDVVVSKLKRFNANDVSDIDAVIRKGLINHKTLIKRFNESVDSFSMDARAQDIPRYVKNLHTVERDMLDTAESSIELPHWV